MKRLVIIAGFMLAAALLFAIGCEKMQMKPAEEAAKTGVVKEGTMETPLATPGTVATIAITVEGGHQVPFSVEIAESDEEREKGLKGRESLPSNGGMWFVFPQTVEEKFWMKDTKFPLDLIYVDEGMKVVHIIENAPAESAELLVSPSPFKYVLEVNAGTAAKHGVKVGNSVEKRIGPQ